MSYVIYKNVNEVQSAFKYRNGKWERVQEVEITVVGTEPPGLAVVKSMGNHTIITLQYMN